MASITEGLFPSVAGLFAPIGTEQTQRLQAAGQPRDPLQAVSGSIGFLGERMQQGIGATFGQMPEADKKRQVFQQLVQQLQQQGVDISTPQGLVQLAQQMSSIPGFEGEALGLRQRAAQMAQQTETQGLEQERLRAQTEQFRAQAAKAGRPDDLMVKTPATFAAVGSSLGIPPKPNLADYTQDEAARINAQIQQNKERESAAGVPGTGEVKVTDLNTATQIVDRFTKEPSQRLGAVRQLRVSLSQAKGGTGAAVPQLKRDLIKLVGDNQIGQNEVQQALGSIGIVGDAISGINQLLTGTPSGEKLKDVEKFINALEKAHAQSYNASRERAQKVLSEGKLGAETVKSLVPPPYEFKGPASKSKFVEGKIYKDAQGNRAKYVNGKFEPVK